MIRQRLTQEASFAVSDLVETTGLTRQGLQGHLKEAMASGLIHRIGRGRGTRYERGARWQPPTTWDTVPPTSGRTGTDVGFDEAQISDALLEWLDSDVGLDDPTTRDETGTTRCVIRLVEHETRFVARSTGKRLMAHLDRFRIVELNFEGVEHVGRSFMDEVFRVWAKRHPETELRPTNMV